MENNYSRINKIANIISTVCSVELESAIQMILETDIGKAIIDNDPCVLYEQITDNTYQIAKELKLSNKHLLTPQAITEAYLK